MPVTRIFTLVLLLAIATALQAESKVAEFWNAYDARQHPLNAEVVKTWSDDIGTYHLVRYALGPLTGTNRSASPIIAAYYGYPKNADKVPAILQIHGGGQRASKTRVASWVQLGFACISINWGGKVLEQADTPNTDWDGLAAGFERPGATKAKGQIHHNGIMPSKHTLYREPHLLNSSWNLIAIAGRRALTFLEQRPEVEASKLGVEGHSMGGRSTVLTAIDPRVKAASPSVGGSGYLYEDMWGLPGSRRRMSPDDNPDLYRQVVSAQSYWPHTTAPTLFLGSTNDFNSPTEFVVRGMAQLPTSTERMLVLAPHLNHRFTDSTSAARFMWMKAHLKGDFTFPKSSPSKVILDTPNQIPTFQVTVDRSTDLSIDRVEVYYGYARDPRVRFWRSATATQTSDNIYEAPCPVFDTSEPLFAFANITYKMPQAIPQRPGIAATDRLTVSSEYQAIYPDALKAANVKATESRYHTIDDFIRDWQDWYRLSHNNPHHWFYATRKVIDPSWMGPKNAKLSVDIRTTEPDNHIAVGLQVNTWQGYTGRKSDSYHAIVTLPNSGLNTITLVPQDFTNSSGKKLTDWDEATELTFTPGKKTKPALAQWKGQPPTLNNLRWQGGTLAKRLYPHQIRNNTSKETLTFEDEFQSAIKDSVDLEDLDLANSNGRVYLTKELISKSHSYWRIMNNLSVSGKPISIAGKTYERGLGVHAPSKVTYTLGKRFATFHVTPGPDDAHHGLLIMKILVDGKEVFATPQTRSHDKADRNPLTIPVSGADTLTLVVDPAGHQGGDHASWADAYLTQSQASK